MVQSARWQTTTHSRAERWVFVWVSVRPTTLGNRHRAPIPLEFNGLVLTEMDQRVAAFEDTIKALDDQINRWT